MFHFPAFPPHALYIQARVTPHHWCWVSPFGHPRITARLATPRGLSQPPTSFIGSRCQGIHRVPLHTYKTHNKERYSRPLYSSQTPQHHQPTPTPQAQTESMMPTRQTTQTPPKEAFMQVVSQTPNSASMHKATQPAAFLNTTELSGTCFVISVPPKATTKGHAMSTRETTTNTTRRQMVWPINSRTILKKISLERR